jgi:Questin oxidase-like
MPYDPDALFNARLQYIFRPESAKEIQSICSGYSFREAEEGEEYWTKKADEFVWASTLLMCATGKEGKNPRLDFFLMHLVTSSLFLRPYLGAIDSPVHKANLLRAYLPVFILITLARGRPRINPGLLMSYTDTPRPPVQLVSHPDASVGHSEKDDEYNPWLPMIGDAIYHPDSHVLKTMRTLVFAARTFGNAGPGTAPGAYRGGPEGGKQKEETHVGTASMDGTVFVRAAGMLMDYMGWVGHGQEARGDWDRSALGWDAAWENEE